MGQGDSARDFDASESMKNAGILDVFPIFHTARLGQKIRRSLQLPLCGVALSVTTYYSGWVFIFLCMAAAYCSSDAAASAPSAVAVTTWRRDLAHTSPAP